MKMLNNKKWEIFEIGKLFEIKKVTGLPIENYKEGCIPYISTSAEHNALVGFVEANEKSLSKKNTISIDPIKGKAFFHEYGFVGRGFSGASVNLLYHTQINRYTGLFLCVVIEKTSKEKASYGNLFNSYRLHNAKILLPIDDTGNPDRSYMESYMRRLEQDKLQAQADSYFRSKLASLPTPGDITPLSEKEWDEFEIGKLFHLKQGKSKGLNHLKIIKNGVNYLGATNRNNGVLCQVEKNKTMIQKGNCIAFIRNGEGSMGYSIYKSEDFIATSDISVGYSDFLTRHVGIFITTLADKVRGKYNFGYKRSDTRLKKEKILLPITDDGSPDYAYMEQYMQEVEYRLIKQYLNRKMK